MICCVAAALRSAADELGAAGVEGPRGEARLLLAEVLGLRIERLIAEPGRELSEGETERFAAVVARRCRREPMAQILGRREFWGLEFKVTAATLDPRADSEAVVAAVLERLADRQRRWRLLDLGTGTGCLLLALLTDLPVATGLGIDASAEAVTVARRNAARLGLADRAEISIGQWAAAVAERFDVIVGNPPYIPTAAIDGLMPEVARFEPLIALDGGADGLAAYRAIAPQLLPRLAPGGFAALEIGDGQQADVVPILARAGLRLAAVRADLGGRPRCLVFEANPC